MYIIYYTYTSGLFYYTLGNIRPHLRSQTKAIQLVSVVKSSYIEKYGIDTILEPFVDAVKQLESVRTFKSIIIH